jgi:hypothetical protein
LINHIRQFRASSAERRTATIDPPPSYEDVVKETPTHDLTSAPTSTQDRSSIDDACTQPPSYLEAVASLTSHADTNVVTEADITPSSLPDEVNIKRLEGVTTIHIE